MANHFRLGVLGVLAVNLNHQGRQGRQVFATERTERTEIKKSAPAILCDLCGSVANHSQINFGRKKTQKPQKETMADRKTKTTLFSSHRLCAFCAFLRPKPFPHLCLIRVSSVAKKTWRPWRLGG